MKKIPTYFERDWTGDRSRVVNEVNPACRWVAEGQGVATKKIDGACAMIRDGALFRRRELRDTEDDPQGFLRADYDPETRKTVGWMPVGDGPEDRWFREAFSAMRARVDGTYELIGPKVQGNPEGWNEHVLIPHSTALLKFPEQPPRDFDGLRAWMDGRNIEGVVWHHPDGRRAKLKLRDFGLKRAVQSGNARRLSRQH
jgi:hypothetical protein